MQISRLLLVSIADISKRPRMPIFNHLLFVLFNDVSGLKSCLSYEMRRGCSKHSQLLLLVHYDLLRTQQVSFNRMEVWVLISTSSNVLSHFFVKLKNVMKIIFWLFHGECWKIVRLSHLWVLRDDIWAYFLFGSVVLKNLICLCCLLRFRYDLNFHINYVKTKSVLESNLDRKLRSRQIKLNLTLPYKQTYRQPETNNWRRFFKQRNWVW